MSEEVVCESLNINAILNARSNAETVNEVGVFSICGGRNDIFTQTVISWLQRTRNVTAINLLLCGANKNVDPLLAKMKKLETAQDDASSLSMLTRKKKKNATESVPKLYLKRQNNLPTTAQWHVLQPDIVAIGLHCLSERWCAKNSPNENLFPITERSAEIESGDELENSEESDSSQDENHPKKRRQTSVEEVDDLCVEHSRRPTLYRTEIYRRIMLLHCMSLIAKYRPKIVFLQNITEPSKQAERRRKEEFLWSFMVELLHRFGVECAYCVRSMGLELKEDLQDDEYPSNDVWCNGVFLERIDNEMCISTLQHEMVQYEPTESIKAIQEASKWIFYDQETINAKTLDKVFNLEKTFYFNGQKKSLERSETVVNLRSKRRKRSVTLPVKCYFPSHFAKSLALYAVAQVVQQF